MTTLPKTDAPARRSTILVARAGITGAASNELEALAARLAGLLSTSSDDATERVRFAYSEQGEPTLHEVVHDEVAQGCDELLVLPLVVPMEPGFKLWLTRALQRWRHAALAKDATAAWPRLRVGEAPGQGDVLLAALQALHARADACAELPSKDAPLEPSLVPPEKYRVLVCQGGPCNNAGASLVWQHLRNLQKNRNLRSQGDGMMSCKTSCLGPCNLAPVVQVFPDATWYGGVDEAGIERIVDEHLLQGRPVAELAYERLPQKQRLR
jgi:(2Fe-2S) ferredoxin